MTYTLLPLTEIRQNAYLINNKLKHAPTHTKKTSTHTPTSKHTRIRFKTHTFTPLKHTHTAVEHTLNVSAVETVTDDGSDINGGER